MRRNDHRNLRVRRHRWVTESRNRNEWIVFCRDDQCRHVDAIGDPQRARPVVVIGGIAETMVWRRVGFVELAHGPDAFQWFQRKFTRKNTRLPAHAALEITDEIPLVHEV